MPYTLAFQTSAKELPFSTPAQVIKDASKVWLSKGMGQFYFSIDCTLI